MQFETINSLSLTSFLETFIHSIKKSTPTNIYLRKLLTKNWWKKFEADIFIDFHMNYPEFLQVFIIFMEFFTQLTLKSSFFAENLSKTDVKLG